MSKKTQNAALSKKAQIAAMSKKAQRTTTAPSDNAPSNWTATRPHKYCGMMDAASTKQTKANKTHLCEACSAIKAQSQRVESKAMACRRKDKIAWQAGGEDFD